MELQHTMTRTRMTSAGTILVAEDDIEIRRLIFRTLVTAGYRVKFADTREDILHQVFSSRSVLAIIGMDSVDERHVEIVKGLRRWSTVPVIWSFESART